MIIYSKIIKKDLKQVVQIWNKTQPYSIVSIMGESIILFYLKYFFSDKLSRNFGLVAKKNKKIIGFILFGRDEIIIRKLFFKKFFYITFSFLKHLVNFRFKNCYLYFETILIVFVRRIIYNKYKKKNCSELLFIGIIQKYLNLGIGKLLFNKSLKYLKDFNYIQVMTDKKNQQAIRYYKKLRFKKNFSFLKKIFFLKKLY